jgi:hypothetical protein
VAENLGSGPNHGNTSIDQIIASSEASFTVNGLGLLLSHSSQRGHHNINDKLVFQTNEGFVFHDSCGLEAGSNEEVKAMQEFLLKRRITRSLDQKLHVIWCVK